MAVWVMKSCAASFIYFGSATTQGSRKSLLPNRVTAGMQWDKYRAQGVSRTACSCRPFFFADFPRNIKPAGVVSDRQ